MEDIAPELYEKLKRGFEARLGADRALQELDARMEDGTATYRDAQSYAAHVGEALAGSFRANLSSDVLPDGRMYYNIATRTVAPLLREDYSIVSAAASRAQEAINRAAHIGLKSQTAGINEDRIDGLVERLTEAARYDDVAWVLGRPVVNFSQAVVDDTVEANADLHARAGLNPKIVREAHGQVCKWCAEMAGTYDYPAPKDVYRRHQGCTCVVEYYPGDGRIQNAHTKAWREAQEGESRNRRIATDLQKRPYERRLQNTRGRGYDVLCEYTEDATPGRGNIDYDAGYDKQLHRREIETASIIFERFGGNIVLKNEASGQKNADYEWNDALWELKSTTTERAANSAIKSGMKQIRENPGGIILNFEDNHFAMDELLRVIDTRMQWYPQECADVIIISNGKVIRVLQY